MLSIVFPSGNGNAMKSKWRMNTVGRWHRQHLLSDPKQLLKSKEKLNNKFFVKCSPLFSLAGMEMLWNQDGGWILLGDDTGCIAVLLRPTRFQCVLVRILTGFPLTNSYIYIQGVFTALQLLCQRRALCRVSGRIGSQMAGVGRTIALTIAFRKFN